MLFNSLDFAIFLPVVFAVYWFALKGKRRAQNGWLLIASYFFYGWWDPRFLILIALSSALDFWAGQKIHQADDESVRKRYLWLSLLTNIGILGLFKYYNFFVDNIKTAFSLMGDPVGDSWSLNLILPIGISFYTLQSLSYTIDIYRRKLKPESDPLSFFTFVAFFPQLIMGPIERATNMLPQFNRDREFDGDQAILGMRQFIWGLFKKVVIADGCAQYVNSIFADPSSASGLTLLIGGIYFTFQIYADFSGYSDMAIGIGRLFGFKLMDNFRYPFFSRSIGAFWRHWHISLMQWFRDYLYIPLGGNRGSKSRTLVHIVLVFTLSGLWHGAAWTFVLFGLYHGLLYAIERLLNWRPSERPSGWKDLPSMLITFLLVLIGFVIFRSPSVSFALDYLSSIANGGLAIEQLPIGRYSIEFLPMIGLFLLAEWWSRDLQFPLQSSRWHWVKMTAVIALLVFMGSYSNMQDFIYFKF